MKTLYLVEDTRAWILKILGNDIAREAEKAGYKVRRGPVEGYGGEEITLNMWWRTAQPYKEAKINSVFVTHTDDSYKEQELVRMKDAFDCFFCMSEEDAQFLRELGAAPGRVFGINLPVRNQYVRPVSIGIFSRCYPDGRKNEQWLLDYCKTHPDSILANFVFIGAGWGKVTDALSSLDCSFEWHNVSQKMPYEYFFQQLKLPALDYYLYMGMDGGALGTYDAYAMGVPLCVTDDGFHKGLPDIDYKFSTYSEFEQQLDILLGRQRRKIAFFEQNSVENYVKRLIQIWETGSGELPSSERPFGYSVVKKRRSHYFHSTFRRLNRHLSAPLHRWRDRLRLRRRH